MSLVTPVTWARHNIWPGDHRPAPAPHDVEITGSQAAPPLCTDFFFSTINLGFGSALDCLARKENESDCG